MKPETFDERICILGEGPVSFGPNNNAVSWVDILGSRVLTRDIDTGETSEFDTKENVGFAIRRTNGGFVLGTNSGPVLRDPNGETSSLFSLQEVDPLTIEHSIRWNDAKVSPNGDLILGTMGYEMLTGTSTLFRYSPISKELRVLLPQLTISNGMDWSKDGSTFYFIDSRTQSVNAYDFSDEGLVSRGPVISIPSEDGAPDGMCIDSEGGIWVALWGGSQIRRYDSADHFKLTEKIDLPVPFVTSCAFAGADLKTLVITTATDGLSDLPPQSGMTFAMKAGVSGNPSRVLDV